MYLLGLGIVLLLLKWGGVGPVAGWNWWTVLAPFALAALWWTWADRSGYTRRKAAERDQARRQARVARTRAALGQRPGRPR
ncbi:TIGR04438 family Trp-rich protein [Pseudorhodoferax sp.]|uniref:TIGR04438 family Trp-rich protein n=1 Tax=Pseudorhodoferax sp. TaxID=1993553 RepID=UPI0039E2CAE4